MTAMSVKTDSKEKDGDKSKSKQNAVPTRIVIRRLPPSMTKEELEEQISPIPDHDHFRCQENI